MKSTFVHKLVAALLCGSLLAGATAAEARGDRDDRRWDRHEYKHHHKHRHDRGWDERRIYRERVIVHRAPPRYRETVVHHYYEPSYRPYRYSGAPAITIGVDIPPLVIPLR